MLNLKPLWLRRILIILFVPFIFVFGATYVAIRDLFQSYQWSYQLIKFQAKRAWKKADETNE